MCRFYKKMYLSGWKGSCTGPEEQLPHFPTSVWRSKYASQDARMGRRLEFG